MWHVLLRASIGVPVRLALLAAALILALTAPAVATAAEDKAAGRPSKASSTEGVGREPAKAVDGSSTTRWSSAHTDGQFWQVDLGRLRKVDTVTVNWEQAYASRYRVSTSTDGSNFSTAVEVSATGAGAKVATFTARSARYVRITGVTRATSWGISFWDVKVHGPADETPITATPSAPAAEEKAAGRPATASSTGGAGLEPAKAADGLTTTRWSSAHLDGQYWQVDLGRVRKVTSVAINWERAYASRYRVSTSTDGSTFATAAEVTNGAPGAKTTTFAAQDARYVRVTGVTRATAWGISFWDVRVLGPADAPPVMPPGTTPPAAPTTPPAPTAPTTPSAPTLLWRGDAEEGSLVDWTQGGGGGEFNSGNADSAPTQERAHSGTWSVKSSWYGPQESGTRLFRWAELHQNRELEVSAWFYFPHNYKLTGGQTGYFYWNLFQFKSSNEARTLNDPIWSLNVRNRADGAMVPELVWSNRTLEGPHRGEVGNRGSVNSNVTLPVGRWFQVKARVRQSKDFDGMIQFWLDGQQIFDMQHVRTAHLNCSYNAWCVDQGWAVNLYTDGLAPSPPVIYVDDAEIRK